MSFENIIFRTLEDIETEGLHGSIHHIAKMQKKILVNRSSILWGSSSPKPIDIKKFSI